MRQSKWAPRAGVAVPHCSRAIHHRAKDSIIQLYFSAGFWFPKSCVSDRLDHLIGAPWGRGTVRRMPLKKSWRERNHAYL